MSALKFKHFNAEDRQPKNAVFGWLTLLSGALPLRAMYIERGRSL